LTQIGNSVASIAQGIFKGAKWIGDPHNWVRVGLVTLGGIVVIGTVVSTTRNQMGGSGSAVVDAAGHMPGVGKIAKAVA